MNVAFVPKNRKLIFAFSFALILMGLVVGAGAAYFYFIKSNSLYTILTLMVGITVILICWIAWPGSDAVLTMNSNGICDRRLGVGVIFWSDIEDVQIESRYNNHFICLRVTEPEKYIRRLNGPKLAKMRYNQKLGFTKFNIDVNSFDVDPLELMEYVRKTSNQHRA